MTVATRKLIVVDFSDMSGGCNNIENPNNLFKNQVCDESIGFALKKSGLVKQPGAVGLSSSITFTDYLRGLFSHRQFSGTESLYGVSGGVLSLISTTDGSLTSKYSMGGSNNEVWSCDAYGKKFVCNGNSTIKIEGMTSYQVGISAPTGASAAATAGSGLPDGTYGVYAGYARSVSGMNVLYSVGQSLGNIVLGSGSNRITITFPNSSDPQVNNKVIWIKSPGELIHYFFQETGDNTTTVIVVSSASEKQTAIVYEYAAADNGLPPAITFIYSFAGRLWGIIDNVFYYSNDGTFSQYAVETFSAKNYRVTPYKLTGIFSVGQNLFFNTDNGILILPYGDVNQKEFLIETRWHFFDMRTVASWNNGVIGLTNQGIRLFDGQQFTTFNYAYPIQEKIDKIYSSSTDFIPCGFVLRKKNRDEYHLMFQDTTLSVTVNTTHAVLNLSSALWGDSNNYLLAWEYQPISGNYAVVFEGNNTLYIGQSNASASKVYRETITTSQISDVYDSSGTLISTATDKQSYLKSRYHIENVAGRMRFNKFYCNVRNEYPFTICVSSGQDNERTTGELTIPPSGGSSVLWDEALWDDASFPSETGGVIRKKMPSHFWCKSVFIEIRQSANDINFKLLQLALIGEVETSNYS